MLIEVTNLVKKYKDNVAVNGVNLEINEGEIFGLLGPNGAGKSTTINALLGLLKINEGSVKMFGKDFSKNAREIKKNIGYVPQDFAFFEQLSALDNVNYWAKVYGLRGNALKVAVKEALDFTGLWDRRKDKANSFSGGMKRRLNIACAIVHKPKILFMDEPTVGVDPQSRNNILESIKILNKNGTTVIYTSHYMEEIEEICTRVAIMDFGKVIASGKIDDLVESISKERKLGLEVCGNVEGVIEELNSIQGIHKAEMVDKIIKIRMERDEETLPKVLETLMHKNIKITSMVLEKENLEAVFLELTGKKLRD